VEVDGSKVTVEALRQAVGKLDLEKLAGLARK